ncbi:MAG: type I-D CRISPR-associated helicase Cas3' [Promethearchaeota archaeon]
MQPIVEFTVKGLESPLYLRRLCRSEMYLYPHQVNMLNLWSKKSNLLLTTGTGSGKTAAVLFPLIKDIEKKTGENAIFVYPTNALIYNQAISMVKTLSMIKILDRKTNELRNIKVAVYPEMSKISDERIVAPFEADIHLVIITSETFEMMEGNITKGKKLLELTGPKLKQTFFLTNPDTLYLLLALKYNQSLYNIQGLQELSTIVIDEFHAYSGFTLANLIYTLKYGDKLNLFFRKIFLSATPITGLDCLIAKLFSPISVPLIIKEKASKKRNIAHDVIVKLYPSSNKDVVIDAKEIITNLINSNEIGHSEQNKGLKTIIPCVVIFNSVINSIELEDQLLSEGIKVEAYRGLMAKEARKLEGKIILGTSAIELGIDFDCKHLIMEASDSSSFLQRFGRAGRHQKSIAHILVPQNVIQKFKKYNNKVISRSIFVQEIKDSYQEKKSLSWFVSDFYGIVLATILSKHLINKIKVHRSTEEERAIATNIFESFISELIENLNISIPSLRLKLKVIMNEPWYEKLMQHIFFRSSYPSVRVYDWREKKKRPENYIYEVDLGTLFRRGTPCEIIETTTNKPTVSITSYKKYHKVTFKSVEKVPKNELLVNAGQQEVYSIRSSQRFTLDRLLKNHVYIIVPNKVKDYLDWRTTLFSFDDDRSTNKYIAFDGDALICKALINRHFLENKLR